VRPTVLYKDATFRMAHLGCVVTATWLDAPKLDQMKTFARNSRIVSHAHDGSALFNLIIDGTPSFDSAVRKEAETIAKESVNRRGAIHAILVDGLRGAATRAFLSGVIMLRSSATPTKVVGDVPAAVKQMRIFLGQRPEADPVVLEQFIRWSISREGEWPPSWGPSSSTPPTPSSLPPGPGSQPPRR
jgi:hypothetical protein